ncbi:MAG: glucokinase [Chloroflexota bacterium]
MLLAGDIGGTKTDLAVFSAEAGPRAPLAQAEFPSGNYSGLEAMAREFLAGVKGPVDRACFDVAGPVFAGHAKITNLPWEIDARALARELNLQSVDLLNDVEAIARAVPILGPADLHTLNQGKAVEGGAIAVVAPGTGMGQAFLTRDGARYRAHATEGGHADFAPATAAQAGLLAYLWGHYDHVSVERVCSGRAIPDIYRYLRDRGSAPESADLARKLADAKDSTPLIVEAALQTIAPDPLCAATIETFVDILGAEAANLALKVLATGGVYLAGGIPPRLRSVLDTGRFMSAFTRKGRFADLMASIPVHVVIQRAALIGAAQYGLERAADRAVPD